MDKTTLQPQAERLSGMLLFALGVVVATMLLLNVALRFSAVSIWDDAYFFTRYADNYRASGSYAWNPADGPSYGLTSVAYGTWVYLVRLLDGAQPMSLWVSSSLWGLAALVAVWLIGRLHERAGANGRLGVMALIFLMVGLDAVPLAVHCCSGMDTTFAMAWLGAYLYLSKRFEGRLSPGKALVIGLLGGVAWYIRPDLLLFPFLLPLAQVILNKKPLQRKMAGYILLFTAFMVLLLMALGIQYLGGFLPLSFYVKSLNSYGPGIARAYRLEGLRQLGLFLLGSLPTLILVPWAWWSTRKQGEGMGFTRNEKSLMVGLALFVAYHAFFVTPIMGYHQRFMHPIWPLMVFLACRSLELLLMVRPGLGTRMLHRPVVPALVLGAAAVVLGATTLLHRPGNVRTTFSRLDLPTAYRELGQNNWPFLPQFVAAGDVSFASTELGILGAMAQGHTVVDLAGLHDLHTAREGLNLDRLLVTQHPDIIYMPHPDYDVMTEQLRRHPAFVGGYREYRADSLQTWLGVALAREGPYFSVLDHIIQHAKDVEGSNTP